jgi:hypothetical protein
MCEILQYIPIYHPGRNHTHRARLSQDRNPKERQYVGMPDLIPSDSLFAKALSRNVSRDSKARIQRKAEENQSTRTLCALFKSSVVISVKVRRHLIATR